MKKITKNILLLSLSGLFSLPALAETPQEQAVNQKLQEIFHNDKDYSPHQMKEIGLNNFYRFKIENDVYGYTDSNAQYIFNGDLILTKPNGKSDGNVLVLKNNQPYPQTQENSVKSNNGDSTISSNSIKDSENNNQTSKQDNSKNRLLTDSNLDNDVNSNLTTTPTINSTDNKIIPLDIESISYVKNPGEKEGSIFYSRLPFKSNSFSITYGKGEREFAMFVDPDCPYCRSLDKSLNSGKNLVNAKVHIFYFPLNIHPYARSHSDYLWCQPNKTEAYNSWMSYIQKAEETDSSVDEHINSIFENWKKDTNHDKVDQQCLEEADKINVKNFELAASLGIKSTPTIMLNNSAVTGGVVNIDNLNKFLDYSVKNPKVDEIEKLTIPSTLNP